MEEKEAVKRRAAWLGRTQGFRNPKHMLPSKVFGTPDLNLGGHAKCQHQAGERTRARRTPERGTKLNTRPLQPGGSCDQRRHRWKETALGESLRPHPAPVLPEAEAAPASRTNTRTVCGEVTDPLPSSSQMAARNQALGVRTTGVLSGEVPTHPRRLVLAQSKTLCTAVTPSRPMGATSPPVMMA